MDEKTRQVKVWADGCYDLVHFGHANSLRQAKALGDYLIVGVHSDEEIAKHKGPPVFTMEERCKMLKAIKWVDEVQENQPYITTIETLDHFKCDFCCHGDDITMTDEGIDTYQDIKKAGRFRVFERTHGVSTTNIVKRLLSLNHPAATNNNERTSPWTGVTLLPTTQKIIEFANNRKPDKGDTIIYCPGGFDLFHVGHLDFLEKVIAQSPTKPFIIIGLYPDHVINGYKGGNYPIMTLHERLLTILACKYVSEVVIGAPFKVTKDLMDHFNVHQVANGKKSQDCKDDPFQYPREIGKLIEINSNNDLTTEAIAERVLKNYLQFQQRNKNKEQKEIEYLEKLKLAED